MQIMAAVPINLGIDKGIWIVDCDPGDVDRIGASSRTTGSRSVVGLKSYTIDSERRLLQFRLEDAIVLNRGGSKECIMISLVAEANQQIGDGVRRPASAGDARNAAFPQSTGRGDVDFIKACRDEGLPRPIIELGQQFLERVRKFSDDPLREGQNRKWVTSPNNFIAITIQNRNMQFCVHIRKTSCLLRLGDKLDIRDDRPGYARFWLQKAEQLEAAVVAAKASFEDRPQR